MKKPKTPSRRVSKTDYYLNLAREVATRSTCLRRNFGAVIVNNDQIIATGYNGAPRGTVNCLDLGVCYREAMGIPRGERYELCRGVHAEQNAIIHAARFEMIGGTIYVAGLDAKTKEPIEGAMCCRLCKRMIINAGIEHVVVRDGLNRVIEVAVATWITGNLGELARKGGKLVPVKLSGY